MMAAGDALLRHVLIAANNTAAHTGDENLIKAAAFHERSGPFKGIEKPYSTRFATALSN